jgi:predicted nucleotidyltransferase
MRDLSSILTTLQAELTQVLGDQMETMYLYGSQARGEAHAGSDIDVLIVINGTFDYGDLLARTSHLVAALSLENDVVISRAFVSKEQFEHGASPFLRNVRLEAVAV